MVSFATHIYGGSAFCTMHQPKATLADIVDMEEELLYLYQVIIALVLNRMKTKSLGTNVMP